VLTFLTAFVLSSLSSAALPADPGYTSPVSARKATQPDAPPKPPGPAGEVKPGPDDPVISAKDRQSKPVNVAEVMKALGLDEKRVSFDDEPPGKLQSLRWRNVKLPGTEAEVNVEIHVAGRLFSERRRWDMKTVRTLTVIEVRIIPVNHPE
jgi:hypothetical protein